MSSSRSNAFRAGAAALLAAGLAVPALTPAMAQTASGSYTLTKITFQGNSQVPTDELMSALPYKVGDKVDHAALQEDANAVGAVYQKHNVGAGITQKMTSLHNKAQLTYVIDEKPPVAPTVVHVGITADTVNVTGNKKISTAQILAASGIKPGDTVTNEKIQAAQTAIQGLYKKANIGASISTDWTNAAQPQHINLVFKITEKDDDN
ncbi:FtsQ-type POTRA domain-containing protein [Acetobacteraceae bacterium KSS8]|uniref:FtsQ-type POTRA domain-containing protein n=1 Tax=Endosaccharibacter trunci TaxID=2812733 RepID=A0ABT1W895_9PROT|nr:FtsQ-type POTRA domain-containing protein [Acetobacteraceae bacterium KSS8]